MSSATTSASAPPSVGATSREEYCPKHPIGARSESALFSLLEVYPVLVSVVEQLEQTELLNLMLTCKTISVLLAGDKVGLKNMQNKAIRRPLKTICEFCNTEVLFRSGCNIDFHPGQYEVEQVHETAKRIARICQSCQPKLPESTTRDCCKCDRSKTRRFLCKGCARAEQTIRTEAKEPRLKNIKESETKPGARCRCGVCARFIPAKGSDKGPELAEACRWCGKMSSYCPKSSDA